MAPPLLHEQRKLIIALREKGMRIVDICQRIGVSKKTVYLWLRRHDTEGTVERQRRDQFFRKTTVEEDRAIVAAHIENPSMSTSTTAAQFQVSNLTIRRRLHQAGVRHRKPAKKKKPEEEEQQDNRVGQVGRNDGKVSWALEKFDCNGEPSTVTARWDRWKRALFIYLDAANVIAPEKKRASLLYFGGYELQQIFYNIVGANVEPAEGIDVFEVGIQKLDAYFAPKQSKLYERNLFRQIKQKPNEKFDKFLARLRQQANRCRYIDPDEHIMDQIVEKCTSKDLRKKIFQKGDSITLEDIIKEANSLEAVKRQMDEYARNNTKKGMKKKRVVKKRKSVIPNAPEEPNSTAQEDQIKDWVRKDYCKTVEMEKKYEGDINSSAFKKFRPVMNNAPVMQQMPMPPQQEPDGMNYFF